MKLQNGQIITVDWRRDPVNPGQDPHPPEPNKRRPAVVVQDTELFDPSYPTVLVVQTCVAKTRITAATESRITVAELQQLRQMVVLAIGGLS